MRANHVKWRLAAGEPSVGTWLALPAPEGAEYVSALGFDWLVVDAEHNPIDIRTLAHPVLRHRVLTNFRAESEGITTDSIIDELLSAVATPKSGM